MSLYKYNIHLFVKTFTFLNLCIFKYLNIVQIYKNVCVNYSMNMNNNQIYFIYQPFQATHTPKINSKKKKKI